MVNVRVRTVSCFSLHVGENVWVLPTFFFPFKDFSINIPKEKPSNNMPCSRTDLDVTELVMADGPRLIWVLLWGLGWRSGAEASDHVGLSQFGERYVIY